MTPAAELARAVCEGDRRALARAITLVESSRADHRDDAVALLDEILPATGNAIRVGISGAPGAGKSTFIESLGTHLVDAGHRVAVLAVDPSSVRSGGSILGDKTRMEQLSRRTEAFIRPSPASGTLGGVARRTREAMLVCEAAGFDVVLVETVGVGQSEVAVAGMVDLFVLLLGPGAGDELQGVKRGIVELADLLVVNKADGDLVDLARHTAADYAHALHLVRSGDADAVDRVRTCSALLGEGIDELWCTVEELVQSARASGELDHRRTEQSRAWMWSEVTDTLLEELRDDPEVNARIASLEADVTGGRISAAAAARRVLGAFPRPVSDALRALALAALRHYDLDVADCVFAAEAFNTVFRVDARDGSRYALRVGSELRIHADGCEELEAAWVNALHAAGFPVARVAPARNGSAVVDVDGHRCLLFDWVPGHRLRDEPTPARVRSTGAVLAAVHEHATGYLVDAPSGALVPDRALYFRVNDRLDELRPGYGSVLEEACERVQEVFDEFWRDPPHPPHLLHGDVQPNNVLVDGDRVTLIDFQDLVWGFEILDIVFALTDMPHADSFRAGYESVRPWPEVAPETAAALSVARYLNVLNFALHVRKPGLDEFVTRIAEPIVAWMEDS